MLTLAGCNAFNNEQPNSPIENTANDSNLVEDNSANNQDENIASDPSVPRCYIDYYEDSNDTSVVGDFEITLRGFSDPFYYKSYMLCNPDGKELFRTYQLFTFVVNNDGYDDFIFRKSYGSGDVCFGINVYDYKNNKMLLEVNEGSTTGLSLMCHIVDGEIKVFRTKSRNFYNDGLFYGIGSFAKSSSDEIEIIWEDAQ